MTSLGLILARGGSQGIPRKNLVDLGGKPLIAWTIEVAKRSGLDRLVVSTDDPKIAAESLILGAEVILRPEKLARGESGSAHRAESHALAYLEETEGYSPDVFVRLQPTSPFRSADNIDAALAWLRTPGVGAVMSIMEAPKHPYLSVKFDRRTGRGYPVFGRAYKDSRQRYPPSYMMNGAIYAAWVDYWKKYGGYDGGETYYFVMDKVRSIDIDDDDDLRIARALV